MLNEDLFKKLRVLDMEVCVRAAKSPSIRELSRELGFEPSHTSKMIKRVEEHLGFDIFERSSKGLSLSAKGFEMIPVFEEVIHALNRLGTKNIGIDKIYTLASTSFLHQGFLAPRID